jgi:hypothetical protein
VSGEASTAQIVAAIRSGESERADALIRELIEEGVGRGVATIRLTLDAYSLNSVSGRVEFLDGEENFFKFHHEEGENETVSEYYRAQLLSQAGLPTEVPLALVNKPGHQLVLYRLRNESRMADCCLEIEREQGSAAVLPTPLLRAQQELDRRIGEVCVATMMPATPASAQASIHQLFYQRLVDSGHYPGGRYRRWYVDDENVSDLLDLKVVVNGRLYEKTIRESADALHHFLEPHFLSSLPVVTAHGDDHHGNVWVLGSADSPSLSLFDPAFATSNIPALLAPLKATFHNALAHPYWLYHPAEADQSGLFHGTVEDGVLRATVPELSNLRQSVLHSQVEGVWRPLLKALTDQNELPTLWRTVVRAGLGACPFLVTNLAAPTRSRSLSLCSLAWVVMATSPPKEGKDVVCELLERIDPQRDGT